VEANIDCQLGCESEGRVDCEAELVGRCSADCETDEGALFCDGQYVDHGGKLKECRQALGALIDVEVTSRGESSGSCGGGACEGSAEGEASVSCSSLGGAAQNSGHAALLGIAGLFAIALVRRWS
jgi:hypothetical protein